MFIYHMETIEYFIDKFKNHGIDISDAIELNNNKLVYDGIHRLVAVKFLDLKDITVKYV